ncbi:lipocalin-like domain-containing protein [Marinibacterium profundimaris]|uniref:AttH domain-containing protein n=1 Tax=Marinibacterium profundimaris TaxID=1679460 RepID=A0A225NLW6_9RHOB|nr:lipocalin-like domain-containing protein [Marinibacterium profundimaris]OWU75036.1 hypothetical protein ATO3_10905 [Marinibacterium profundimaris]
MTRRIPRFTPFRAAMFAIPAAIACLALAVFLQPGPSQGAQEDDMFGAADLQDLLAAFEDEPFARPSGPWSVSLPRDYGAHEAMRGDTWMMALHLEDEAGTRIGMTFGLVRLGLRAQAPGSQASPWALRTLYRGHLSLAEDGAAALEAEERFSRGAGAAGADSPSRKLWLDDWQIDYGGASAQEGLTLSASANGLPVRLHLSPAKAPVAMAGDDGAPVRGFVIPRLNVQGTIGKAEAERRVHGVAWLDRLWGDLPLPGGPLSNQRLILHLDDGTDLTLLRTQRSDGRGLATVEGLAVFPDGEALPLPPDGPGAIDMTATASWTTQDGSATYPVAWQLTGPGLDLTVAPMIENQDPGFALPGWIGAVTVSGRHDGVQVAGMGTLQMTDGSAP